MLWEQEDNEKLKLTCFTIMIALTKEILVCKYCHIDLKT